MRSEAASRESGFNSYGTWSVILVERAHGESAEQALCLQTDKTDLDGDRPLHEVHRDALQLSWQAAVARDTLDGTVKREVQARYRNDHQLAGGRGNGIGGKRVAEAGHGNGVLSEGGTRKREDESAT